VRSAVKEIVCNARITALKIKADSIRVFLVQVYMPAPEYEHDKVEVLYDITEDTLEEDGKDETNTIIMRDPVSPSLSTSATNDSMSREGRIRENLGVRAHISQRTQPCNNGCHAD
jgi:hypothetical protein